MSKNPYFSEKLAQCDGSGTHTPFSSRVRIEFFEDRVHIGKLSVLFPYLRALHSSGNVLNIAYVQADGTVLEKHFRYDSFLPGTAPKRLEETISQVLRHINELPKSTLEAANEGIPEAPEIVVTKKNDGGRVSVQIRDPVVLFPLVCPKCGNAATTVDRLRASTLFNQQATWIVPTCDDHPHTEKSIFVKKWEAHQSGVEFSFRNAGYADQFQKLNEGKSVLPTSTRLGWEVERGTRFVVFKYAVSALYIAAVNTSKVHKIEPGASISRAALPYTLLSVLAGWWSLPGPIMTVQAIRTNLRGGIDLTPKVRSAVSNSGNIRSAVGAE